MDFGLGWIAGIMVGLIIGAMLGYLAGRADEKMRWLEKTVRRKA